MSPDHRTRGVRKDKSVPKMTRHDFHCITNSLNSIDASKVANLEELLKKCIIKSTSTNPEKADPSRRSELVSEKFRITPGLFNEHAESSNLETIEYFVNNFMPILSNQFPSNPQKFSPPANYKQKSATMKELLGHLMSFYREMHTEVNILNSLKETDCKFETPSQLPATKKGLRTPKYEKPLKKKKKTNGGVTLNYGKLSVKKNECIFENCTKEYTTPGALSFHIRSKHNKKTDPLKKDYLDKAKKKGAKAKASDYLRVPETNLGKRVMETSGGES
jgi:hypothetical protein